MNPLRIIRWPVLIFVVATGWAANKFGVPHYLDRALTSQLEESFQSSARIDKATLSIVDGVMKLDGLRVDDPLDKSKWLLAADSIDIKFDPSAFLTRRLIIHHIDIHSPKAAIERKPENDDESRLPGLSEEEVLRKAREIYGKVEKAKDWYDKVKNIVARLKAKKIIDDERAKALEKYQTELPEVGPEIIIERVSIDGLELELKDNALVPKLVGGSIAAKSITNRPEWYKDAMTFAFGSRMNDLLSGPALGITCGITQKGAMQWSGLLDSLPVQQISALVGESLPVKLLDGKISLSWNGWFQGLDTMELKPTIIFENLKLEPKPGFFQVAGFDAASLTKEFTLAGRFALEDITISGDPMAPKIDMGNTVSKLMQMGGKAFAQQFGGAVVDRLLGQLRGQLPGGEAAGALIGTLLQGGDVGKALESTLQKEGGNILQKVADGVLNGSKDGKAQSPGDLIKEKLGGAIPGIGGDKKDKPTDGTVEKKDGGSIIPGVDLPKNPLDLFGGKKEKDKPKPAPNPPPIPNAGQTPTSQPATPPNRGGTSDPANGRRRP